MMSRLVLIACIVASLAALSLADGDRTLGTVSGPCKDQFTAIINQQYADDKQCADSIKKAMTTVPKTSDADCPGGAKATAGSSVQKCMSKNQKTKDAWVSFIKGCEVLNVNERTGAGEAEAASKPQPSCFPRFDNLKAFQSFLDSGSSSGSTAKSAAGSSKAGVALLAVAAAAAGLLL